MRKVSLISLAVITAVLMTSQVHAEEVNRCQRIEQAIVFNFGNLDHSPMLPVAKALASSSRLNMLYDLYRFEGCSVDRLLDLLSQGKPES